MNGASGRRYFFCRGQTTSRRKDVLCPLKCLVDTFLQQVVNGLTLGCVYAVVALGYTKVYGIIQLINFAHGEVVMIGCMVAFSVIVALAGSGMPPLLIVAIGTFVAVPVCMAVGFVVERVA